LTVLETNYRSDNVRTVKYAKFKVVISESIRQKLLYYSKSSNTLTKKLCLHTAANSLVSSKTFFFCRPEQLGSEGGASSSQLQLSETHCRFTFASRPSVAVSFKHGSRLIFSGWPFTDFSPENYWRDWTQL